jgi:uncharacterized protein YdcH (DUF465 family)
MTQTQSQLSKLIHTMKVEMKLFDEFADGENRLNDLAKKKKWAEMQSVLEELNGLAEKIEECEDTRNTVYTICKAEMKLKEDDGFQLFLAQVPEKHRETLAGLHAGLKKRLLAIKSLSSGLIYYFACMQDSIAQVLGEIFPHRKGKLYSPQGETKESSEEAVVVNHKL